MTEHTRHCVHSYTNPYPQDDGPFKDYKILFCCKINCKVLIVTNKDYEEKTHGLNVDNAEIRLEIK